jgi:hypothetical protein
MRSGWTNHTPSNSPQFRTQKCPFIVQLVEFFPIIAGFIIHPLIVFSDALLQLSHSARIGPASVSSRIGWRGALDYAALQGHTHTGSLTMRTPA